MTKHYGLSSANEQQVIISVKTINMKIKENSITIFFSFETYPFEAVVEVYDQVFHLALQESRVKVKIKATQRKLEREKFFTYHYVKKRLNKC